MVASMNEWLVTVQYEGCFVIVVRCYATGLFWC